MKHRIDRSVASAGTWVSKRAGILAGCCLALGMHAVWTVGQTAADEPALSQREIVRRAMRERPGDPWPRGLAHVVLATPGSQQPEKAYHEPGGGFSPAVGSFGVAIWVRDAAGTLKATSDTLPMPQIQQRFRWPNPRRGHPTGAAGILPIPGATGILPIPGATGILPIPGATGILPVPGVGQVANLPGSRQVGNLPHDTGETPAAPAIATTAPHYEATWSVGAPGRAALELAPRGDPSERLELVVRSVGPAGGPITSIEHNASELKINGCWTMTITPPPTAVHLGHEGDPGWTSQQTLADRWAGADGWGYARIELARGSTCKVVLQSSVPPQPNPLKCPTVRAALTLELPDRRFVECLHAQTAHLLMGLFDRRTPPGEPTNYPLAWHRDGVAVVAGLVRAGQTEVARQLAEYFAENDFFGGFGAEGDAPGQGLRVLEDVAGRLQDPKFDQWLWPHVQRKAALILKMAAADKPLRMPYVGPIVPKHRGRDDLDLVCEPARDGRIVGRMDFGRPASYITAVSYSGLRGAAALARRLNHPQQAERWQSAAEQLQKAWLKTTQWTEQRTYISGLWPTWVAEPEKSAYCDQLARHCDPRGFEPWTYFSAAAAHQWVFLDRPDRAWETLDWFWNRQTSPGLYTWWEGTGEENTFHLWENVRGWVKPPNVTPHYWTAGEVLAMQVDMLAYVDDSHAEPVLVIGGGVPASWVDRPMRVAGVPASVGRVDWTWKDGKLEVVVGGRSVRVRAGPAFGRAEVVIKQK